LANGRQENDHSFTQIMSASEDSSIIPKPPTSKTSHFDNASSNAMISYGSQNRRFEEVSILGTNQTFTNGSRTRMNYGLTSPDQDTKRFVQSATLHTPYRHQTTKEDISLF